MTQGQGLMGQVWSAYEKHCSECSFFKKMIFWIHDWKQQECQLVQSVPWSNHTSGFSWLQEVMEPNWTSKSVNMEADQSAIKLLLTSIGFCIPCTSTAWWWLVVHCLQTPETWNVHILFMTVMSPLSHVRLSRPTQDQWNWNSLEIGSFSMMTRASVWNSEDGGVDPHQYISRNCLWTGWCHEKS